jgi:putative alpha-1,2-mannosidase
MMRPKIIRLKPLFLLTAPCLRLKSEAIDIAKLSVLLLSFSTAAVWAQTQDYTRWVNPFIGTGGHGHTFPGAVMPFGMVQLSPDTRGADWDGSSGYHYSDDVIYGFSHTHLSGTGIPDGCDILFMPTTDSGKNFTSIGQDAGGYRAFASSFSHANEKAEPGYYSVRIDDGKLLAEMTATKRVGFHRYTFPASKNAGIDLDLIWRDKVLDRNVKVVSNRRIEGYRRSSSWAKDQVVYFVAEFSKPFKGWGNGRPSILNDDKDDGLFFGFDTKDGEQILLKVAISSVSIEGARKNLAAELPGWDFDKVRADARAAWNKELSKIEVSGGTDAQTTTFYTALYHTMIHPSLFNDVDGSYRGLDGKTHNICESISGNSKLKTGNCIDYQNSVQSSVSSYQSPRSQPSPQYTVFSLWDTFRAAHPLFTIIEQKRTVDFINTFIRMYEQGGRLPVWELWGNETDTMIGYHAVSVIADAMAKGIKGFDYDKAYEAAKHSAELDRDGLAAYKKRGYISSEDENESVSKTLEYAYDDWCISQMARILLKNGMDAPASNREPNQQNQIQSEEVTRQAVDGLNIAFPRSLSFENLFDPSTGFMRPKKNGGFVSPFEPNEVTFNYTEGNAWVYTFFVPQDISRLIELEGGREKFAAKLDELFNTKDKLTGREQPDITGLIGQYAHGNEPSHHIAYLYDYVGQPWKTQKYVRQIMDEFYKNAPDGLIGNEDCGQMSAWYVLSATGLYSVTPGNPAFAFGTPLFPSVVYHLEDGTKFVIHANNVSNKNIYIKSARLNGSFFRDDFILYQNILRGGVLEFEMTDEATLGTFERMQSTGGTAIKFAAVPIVESEGRTFKDKESIALRTISPNSKIYYTLDGRDPTYGGQLYTKPIEIRANTTIKAITKLDDIGGEPPPWPNIPSSSIAEATFVKRSNNWTVKIDSKYSNQYTGGGDEGLIDGIRGTTNFASGEWQGYQGQDFVATVDLQKETEIHGVGAGFLQAARSWIWMPTHIQFEVSDDSVNFRPVADIKTDVAIENMDPVKRDYRQAIPTAKARYIRVHAYNLGKIPSWHPGAGGDAYIFVDEILID